LEPVGGKREQRLQVTGRGKTIDKSVRAQRQWRFSVTLPSKGRIKLVIIEYEKRTVDGGREDIKKDFLREK